MKNINGLHFALLHVRNAKFVYTGHARGRQAQGVVPPALERDRVPAHAAARRPDHLHDEVPRRDARDLRLMRSTGGHSYQDGHYICDYYLKSLGLPEIGGKGLFAA